ncbi:MAG: LysM peptidoglycan-binding domain-containing protein [Acidobacteria bacterium]|nr:LysM peptidoglycan-binding domain-containing protein [Acidobacteriota bacterium]
MIGSSRIQLAGVVCAIALLAAACSGRSAPRFPGAIASTAGGPADSEPAAQPQAAKPVEPPAELAVRLTDPGSDTTGEDAEDGASGTPPPRAATDRVTAADLWPSAPDIDIPMNAHVKEFIELFTGERRAFLERGLSRGMQYLPMIREILKAEELPIDLAYIPLVESGFTTTAVSGAQAKGIWQFMSMTGLENGLTHDWYIDERAEAEKATRAAAKYLKSLQAMFDGDWALALAAYNAGQGRVQRAMKRSGRSDYWSLIGSTMHLPRETRNYVPSVMATMVIARDPARYGFDIQAAEAPRVETVFLPAAVDLRWIATWIGSSVSAIQALNPELRRWLTPVRAADHPLKVPAGTGDIIRANLAQARPDAWAPLDWHTVEKGETLVAVARKLNVTRTDLAEANYLSTRARLQAGQRLIVPRAPELQLARAESPPTSLTPAARVSSAETDDDATGTQGDTRVAQAQPLPVETAAAQVSATADVASPSAPIVHRVRPGDTLYSLARLYQTTVASLKRWNHLQSNTILIGQRLTIITGQTTTATY